MLSHFVKVVLLIVMCVCCFCLRVPFHMFSAAYLEVGLDWGLGVRWFFIGVFLCCSYLIISELRLQSILKHLYPNSVPILI